MVAEAGASSNNRSVHERRQGVGTECLQSEFCREGNIGSYFNSGLACLVCAEVSPRRELQCAEQGWV